MDPDRYGPRPPRSSGSSRRVSSKTTERTREKLWLQCTEGSPRTCGLLRAQHRAVPHSELGRPVVTGRRFSSHDADGLVSDQAEVRSSGRGKRGPGRFSILHRHARCPIKAWSVYGSTYHRRESGYTDPSSRLPDVVRRTAGRLPPGLRRSTSRRRAEFGEWERPTIRRPCVTSPATPLVSRRGRHARAQPR